MMGDIVTVKLQRPLYTNGSKQEVLSYIVDDDGEQTSNDYISEMSEKDIKAVFGEHYKVYYLGEYTEGKPVELYTQNPVWEDEWV